MRFGLNVANFGYLGDVRTQLELALAAEEAGRRTWVLIEPG